MNQPRGLDEEVPQFESDDRSEQWALIWERGERGLQEASGAFVLGHRGGAPPLGEQHLRLNQIDVVVAGKPGEVGSERASPIRITAVNPGSTG